MRLENTKFKISQLEWSGENAHKFITNGLSADFRICKDGDQWYIIDNTTGLYSRVNVNSVEDGKLRAQHIFEDMCYRILSNILE